MGSLAIVRPIIPVTTSLPRFFSPDPKEAIVITTDSAIQIDFGQAVTLDSVYLGYHSAAADQQYSLATTTDYSGTGEVGITGSQPLRPLGLGFPYHSFLRFAPTTSRYWKLYLSRGSASYYLGVGCFGLAMQLQYGTEWGAGRIIEDTGNAERLFGGGFGIDDGVAASGYQWTFGDIQPAELRQLYQLVKERRTTRSVLVVEDPDQTDGLNERLHWGLFRKIDAYERLDPINTKWSLQIGDWA